MEPQLQFGQPEQEQQQPLLRVRCSACLPVAPSKSMIPYHLTYDQLKVDLYQAYYDVRRHKRQKAYQVRFEADLDANIGMLCDELWTRTYKARASACFIITDPKKREVFAADFRDRIVHHLYYNYTHSLYERTFIEDTYSCIPGRGTHYGIHRLQQHICRESQNYTLPCYVLKMDIQGYFMHIQRERLLSICLATLDKMATHRILKQVPTTWAERIDMDFVRYLTREIVLLDPTQDCYVAGDICDWGDLPAKKSLFLSPVGSGLPIGNLTSQLFSNVYMNVLDQYMKRVLHCEHYGRYVDDFFVVSTDREWLHSLIADVRCFVKQSLGLTLHEGKTQIINVRYGVEFLGAMVKPHHIVVGRTAYRRMYPKIQHALQNIPQSNSSLISFGGLLCHGTNYGRIKEMFDKNKVFAGVPYLNRNLPLSPAVCRFFLFNDL